MNAFGTKSMSSDVSSSNEWRRQFFSNLFQKSTLCHRSLLQTNDNGTFANDNGDWWSGTWEAEGPIGLENRGTERLKDWEAKRPGG